MAAAGAGCICVNMMNFFQHRSPVTANYRTGKLLFFCKLEEKTDEANCFTFSLILIVELSLKKGCSGFFLLDGKYR